MEWINAAVPRCRATVLHNQSNLYDSVRTNSSWTRDAVAEHCTAGYCDIIYLCFTAGKNTYDSPSDVAAAMTGSLAGVMDVLSPESKKKGVYKDRAAHTVHKEAKYSKTAQ